MGLYDKQIKRLDKEISELRTKLTQYQQDIVVGRSQNHPLGQLCYLEDKVTTEIALKEAEKERLATAPVVVSVKPEESNQVVFATSSVREKDQRILPK